MTYVIFVILVLQVLSMVLLSRLVYMRNRWRFDADIVAQGILSRIEKDGTFDRDETKHLARIHYRELVMYAGLPHEKTFDMVELVMRNFDAMQVRSKPVEPGFVPYP